MGKATWLDFGDIFIIQFNAYIFQMWHLLPKFSVVYVLITRVYLRYYPQKLAMIDATAGMWLMILTSRVVK